MKKILTWLAPVILSGTAVLTTSANTTVVENQSYWSSTYEKSKKNIIDEYNKDTKNLSYLMDCIAKNNQQMKHKNNKQAVYYNSYFGEINTNDYLNSAKVNYTLEPINGVVAEKLNLLPTDGLTLNTAFAIKKGFYISQQEASIDQIACDQNKIDWNATQNAIVNLSLNEISQKPLHEVPASDIIDPTKEIQNKVESSTWSIAITLNIATLKKVYESIDSGIIISFISAMLLEYFGFPLTALVLGIIACILEIYNDIINSEAGSRGVTINLFFGFILCGIQPIN